VSTRDNDEVRHADEMVIGGNFAANWLQEFLGFREQQIARPYPAAFFMFLIPMPARLKLPATPLLTER
jgi:hypothetical protein